MRYRVGDLEKLKREMEANKKLREAYNNEGFDELLWTKRPVFAVSIQAVKTDEGGKQYSEHEVMTSFGGGTQTVEEAERDGLEEALREWPTEEGWGGHGAKARKIDAAITSY